MCNASSLLDLVNPFATLGADVVQQLRVLTDGIVKNIDDNLASTIAVYEELRAAVLRMYPDAKLIKVDFTRPPEEGVQSASYNNIGWEK